MFIRVLTIIKYIRDTENLLNSPSYYGQKVVTKMFLVTFRQMLQFLEKRKSLLSEVTESVAQAPYSLKNYKPMLDSIKSSKIRLNLLKKLFNQKRLEILRKAIDTNTFTLNTDYTKCVDMRIGLLLLLFIYLLLSYQINNKSIDYCNPFSMEILINSAGKFLNTEGIFPINVSESIKNSFTNSYDFKALLIQSRDFKLKEE